MNMPDYIYVDKKEAFIRYSTLYYLLQKKLHIETNLQMDTKVLMEMFPEETEEMLFILKTYFPLYYLLGCIK